MACLWLLLWIGCVVASNLDDSISRLSLLLGDIIARDYYPPNPNLATHVHGLEDLRLWTTALAIRALDERNACVNVTEKTTNPAVASNDQNQTTMVVTTVKPTRAVDILRKPIPQSIQTLFMPRTSLKVAADGGRGVASMWAESEVSSLLVKTLAVMDTSYAMGLKVPGVNTSDSLWLRYSETPVRKYVTFPIAAGVTQFASFLPERETLQDLPQELKTQDVSASSLLPQMTCEPIDKTYLPRTNRIIFYNAIAAGLQSIAFPADTLEPSKPAVGGYVVRESPLPPYTPHEQVSRLTLQLSMLQSIARAANLPPDHEAVKTIIYATIVADRVSSHFAKAARHLADIVERYSLEGVPKDLVADVRKKVALEMVERWGLEGEQMVRPAPLSADASWTRKLRFYTITAPARFVHAWIPLVRQVSTFVTDVGHTYGVGKVAQWVFCPMDWEGGGDVKVSPDVKRMCKDVREEL
ncbi:hypothetical protein BZG36_03941 [Bifiguratus adelaidae]|uniref:Uncharacterized protein n=1 Tax=Bifiguratus adelaidae TaxID=1938954 RepID=A0A261Y047_9FUNG|nr:hypothetical protein BZG36_03941 [Bifiguratus adelaidae]